jgi:hypothetical protein
MDVSLKILTTKTQSTAKFAKNILVWQSARGAYAIYLVCLCDLVPGSDLQT